MIVPSRPFPAIGYILPKSGGQYRLPLAGMGFYSYGRFALLHGMIQLGLEPGDTVAVPAYFCESALQPLIDYGFELMFVDVDDNMQLPLDAVKAVLASHEIKAVLLVHFFGFIQASRDDIVALCQAESVKVVEDCGHSFLSCRGILNARLKADAYIFSMRKILPVADGGALFLGEHAGDAAGFLRPAPGSLLADLPFLILRTIEEMVVKLTWPNLYGPEIGRLKVALSRIKKKMAKAERRGALKANMPPPSYSLMRYLCSEPYLRHVAESRVLNYRKLSQAMAPMGMEAIAYDVFDNEVPQVFPMLGPAKPLVSYLRKRGIGAYRWPGEEIPGAVKLNPSLYPNAIRLNESIACLPIHQDIQDRHIAFMTGAVADWMNTSSADSKWRW